MENGDTTMSNAMLECSKDDEYFIDMVVVSMFEGFMPKQFIREPVTTSWLDKNMHVAWESEKFPTKVKNEDGQICEGSLKFVVYLKNKKN